MSKIDKFEKFATGRHVERHLLFGAVLNLAARSKIDGDFNSFADLN